MGDKETNMKWSCTSQCPMIRNKWDHNISNISTMAKDTPYAKEPSNTLRPACHLKARDYLANAKTAKIKVWQVTQN